jgi:uncharacterized peroxidase-related enzyme
MTYLPSLPGDAVLLDVFRAYSQTAGPLLDYHQALLRGPSPLTVAERELIAAYVSGLNACRYCHGVHAATAQAFGISEGMLGALLADVATAPAAERMKPLLRYVAKLTLTPARITAADAGAVLAAGFQEQALHDAVAVCGLFNMMNRLVEGLGITAGRGLFHRRGAQARRARVHRAEGSSLTRARQPDHGVRLLTLTCPARVQRRSQRR